jgi:hypothetical protein
MRTQIGCKPEKPGPLFTHSVPSGFSRLKPEEQFFHQHGIALSPTIPAFSFSGA